MDSEHGGWRNIKAGRGRFWDVYAGYFSEHPPLVKPQDSSGENAGNFRKPFVRFVFRLNIGAHWQFHLLTDEAIHYAINSYANQGRNAETRSEN